jgi:catechol 2,3-dioxygenase-like lactoylglutathione lyase family enzyme
MKPNSISGINCFVEDLARTAEFYETLGFRPGKEEPDRITFYVNWFFITFVDQARAGDAELDGEAQVADKGAGLSLYVKVDDVDDFYNGVVSKDIKPTTEPRPRRNGREFMLRDPDGYKLVFFEKK